MKSLIYLSLLLIIVSCNKDDVFELDCEPIEVTGACFDCPYYTIHGTKYSFPYFNPNNSEEFIYSSFKGTDWGIIKHNFITGENDFVLKNVRFSGRPKWSKKDWIIFPLIGDGPTFDIWKIKSNGDSLTQLTFTGQCHYPEWNLAGDKFIYHVGYTSPAISIIADEFGNTLDTISGGGLKSWQHDSLLVSGGSQGVGYFSMNTKQYTYIYLYDNTYVQNGSGAIWINDKEIIWTNNKGIFKINRETEQAELIHEACDSHLYTKPTYSTLSNKLIFVKINQWMENELTIGQSYNLVMMNTDGSGEEVIELPH